MRAGEAMEAGLRECARSVRLGKILIQRVSLGVQFLLLRSLYYEDSELTPLGS